MIDNISKYCVYSTTFQILLLLLLINFPFAYIITVCWEILYTCLPVRLAYAPTKKRQHIIQTQCEWVKKRARVSASAKMNSVHFTLYRISNNMLNEVINNLRSSQWKSHRLRSVAQPFVPNGLTNHSTHIHIRNVSYGTFAACQLFHRHTHFNEFYVCNIHLSNTSSWLSMYSQKWDDLSCIIPCAITIFPVYSRWVSFSVIGVIIGA